MKGLLLIPFLAVLPLAAADTSGFAYWSAGGLHGFEHILSKKIDATKSAGQVLAKYDGYFMAISHREGTGSAEWHASENDIFVVESGGATLVYGGTLVDAKPDGAGQMIGSSIHGGKRQKLAAGDVVHIPAKTPHQLLIAPGSQFTYFVIKVLNRP